MESTGPEDCEPFGALTPDQAPEAVQEVAFVDFQVKVAEPPWATVLGDALRLTLGAAEATVTVVDWDAWPPPRPMHVNV